jgi:hypothetical protein
MNRRFRILCLATYLSMGGYLMQLGGCFTAGVNSALASFPFPSLLDSNQLFLGVFAPCGTPNIQVVDQSGAPSGPILNTQDDLVFFCPVTFVQTGTGGG